MNDLKPWYLSKTVWAALVAMALSIGGLAGLPTDEGDGEAIAEAIVQAATALAAMAALVGRIVARSRLR